MDPVVSKSRISSGKELGVPKISREVLDKLPCFRRGKCFRSELARALDAHMDGYSEGGKRPNAWVSFVKDFSAPPDSNAASPAARDSDGAGLLPDDLLERLSLMQIPEGAQSNAEAAAEVARSAALMAASQEKQLQVLKESGRLADIRVAESMFHGLMSEYSGQLRSMSSHLLDEAARAVAKQDSDRDRAAAVLDLVQEEVARVATRVQELLDDEVRRFQDETQALARRRVNRR